MVSLPLRKRSWYGGKSEKEGKQSKNGIVLAESGESPSQSHAEEESHGTSIFENLVEKDLEKLSSNKPLLIEKGRRSSHWNSLLSFSKMSDVYESENDGNSVVDDNSTLESERGNKLGCEIHGKLPGGHRSSTSLSFGSSITPFKIRENLGHFLGLSSMEDLETKEDLSETEQQTLKLYDTIGRPRSKDSFSFHQYINKYPGIPCTRLALLDHNQKFAFIYQLNNIKKYTKDYNLYFKWSVWLIQMIENKKQSNIDRLLENNLDVKIFLKELKRMITADKYYKIHIFKFGLIPNKNSKELISSDTLEFRVPFSHEFDLLKELINIILKDELYRPESIQLPVCGLSFKKLKKYSVISIWLQVHGNTSENENASYMQDVLRLIEYLKEIVNEQLHYVLDSAILMNNETSNTIKIFE